MNLYVISTHYSIQGYFCSGLFFLHLQTVLLLILPAANNEGNRIEKNLVRIFSGIWYLVLNNVNCNQFSLVLLQCNKHLIVTHGKWKMKWKIFTLIRYILSSSYVRGTIDINDWDNKGCPLYKWGLTKQSLWNMKCKSKYIDTDSGFVRYKTPLLNKDSTYLNTIKPFLLRNPLFLNFYFYTRYNSS